MVWYLALALFGLILGAVQGWLGMRGRRAPLERADVLLAWSDRPDWPWVTDPWGSALVLAHGAALSSLLALLLLSLSTASFDASGYGQCFASAAPLFAGVLCGTSLVFPFASRFIGPVRRSITPDALIFGQYVIPWESCSHYAVDRRSQTLIAYSARNPTVQIFDSRPADPGTLQQAVALAAQHLPDRPPVPISIHDRWGFVLLFLLVTAPFVTAGLLLNSFGVSWAWAYDALALLAVFVLGGGVFSSALPSRWLRETADRMPQHGLLRDPLVLTLLGVLGVLVIFSNLLIACLLLFQSVRF